MNQYGGRQYGFQGQDNAPVSLSGPVVAPELGKKKYENKVEQHYEVFGVQTKYGLRFKMRVIQEFWINPNFLEAVAKNSEARAMAKQAVRR